MVQKLKIVHRRDRELVRFARSCQHLSCVPRPGGGQFSLAGSLRGLNLLLRSSFRGTRVRFVLHDAPSSVCVRNSRGRLSRIFLGLLGGDVRSLRKGASKRVRMALRMAGGLCVELLSGKQKVPVRLRRGVFIPFFAAGARKANVKLDLYQRVVGERKNGFCLRRDERKGAVFIVR